MNPSSASETYSRRLWRRFVADTFARYGFRIIIVLFIVAAMAPFLANNHALVRVVDGRTEFPIFRTLDSIEWRFLLYVPLAGVVWVVRRRLFARRGMGVLVVLVMVAAVEIFVAVHEPYNDSSNDRELKASFVLMPPVPYAPTETTRDQFALPSLAHLCGTDSTGRDIASRLLHGARISLSVGFVSQAVALTIGVLLGALAGYFRSWVDFLVCRIIEIMDCFPPLLLTLVIVSVSQTQNSIIYMMAVIGFTSWTGVARLVRGEFLRLGGQSFPAAARALGASDARIILRHLLPNTLGPIQVAGTFGVASAILLESSLSFLGFGIQAPTASWGAILSEARPYIDFAWWLAFFPSAAMLVTIMSYNFVGEGLRDAVDPRLRVK
jgi:peptide/nickel transport system permease protein